MTLLHPGPGRTAGGACRLQEWRRDRRCAACGITVQKNCRAEPRLAVLMAADARAVLVRRCVFDGMLAFGCVNASVPPVGKLVMQGGLESPTQQCESSTRVWQCAPGVGALPNALVKQPPAAGICEGRLNGKGRRQKKTSPPAPAARQIGYATGAPAQAGAFGITLHAAPGSGEHCLPAARGLRAAAAVRGVPVRRAAARRLRRFPALCPRR